ncbi:MAG: Chromosome partitioning protein ParB family, partial [Belnapia sp.]|nr:Chromosome partitioning protein ParB family [Belnapia sp.]
AKPAQAEPSVAALERELSERLGLQISIRTVRKGGHLTIAYRDLDQLDGVIRLLQGG